jgi:oligopeptide/dipeptide ABC transporter ATP-binding protein
LEETSTCALKVSDVGEQFNTRRGIYKALNGVNILLKKGEIFGIAGESGCGKSTLGLTIMGLLPRNAFVTSGEVLLEGQDLVAAQRELALSCARTGKFNLRKSENVLKKQDKEMADIRGRRISMVFQDPMTSLNPVLPVGYQIAEGILVHQPELLAQRRLARVKATKDDLEQILALLKEGESAVYEYAKSRGLQGIEEQALNIWRRNDLGEAKKEKMILSLHSEEQKLGTLERTVLNNALERKRTGSWLRLPGIKGAANRVLVKEGYVKAIELLSMLEVPNPDKVVKMYPHELSGGMRQRITIAIALANNPQLIIMDEPTSALDVTVQAQILELIRHLKHRFNTSFLLISHDLSVLAEVCDRISIMYAGRIVEVASTEAILKKPLHPYTKLLIASIPTVGGQEEHSLQGIGGTVPDMRNPPPGCAFHPRCPQATASCSTTVPEMVEVEEGHFIACFLGDKKC